MSDRPDPTTGPPVTLLRAGPGAGKTTLLVERARAAQQAGLPTTHILLPALESAAAQALERRFLATVEPGAPLPLPQILTYEQLARQILASAHGDPGGRFLDPQAERLLVGRASCS
jgi:hypothetical protein